MNRPLPKRPSEIDPGTRADDDRDPWSEFLPESTTGARPADDEGQSGDARVLTPPVKSPWTFTPRSLQLLTVDESDAADFVPEVRELVPKPRVADAPAQTAFPPQPVETEFVDAPLAAPEPVEPPEAPPEVPEPVYRYEPRTLPEPEPDPAAIARPSMRAPIEEAAPAVDESRSLSLAALIPDMADVLITVDGLVATKPGAGGDSDVRALGRILHTLLQGAKTPLPLRLFVTASLSAHRYQSVEFFADALSHYGGDNSAELIAALYKRAIDARSKPATRGKTSLEQVLRRPSYEVSARKPRGRAIIVAVAAVALSAMAAGLWFWRTARPTSAAVGASEVPSGSSAAQTRSGDNWQLGLIDVPEFSPEPVVAPAPPPPPAARRTPASRVRTPAPVLNLPAVIPEPPPPPPPIPAVREPVRSVVDRRPAITEPAVALPAYTDPKIYERADADVQPPVAQSPQALSQLFPDGPDGRPENTLELVIDERGAVQSARLQNRPRTMAEGNTIPTAKMWKFRPAFREGLPVKYRLLVPLGSAAPR
jgi:hypothetical protein